MYHLFRLASVDLLLKISKYVRAFEREESNLINQRKNQGSICYGMTMVAHLKEDGVYHICPLQKPNCLVCVLRNEIIMFYVYFLDPMLWHKMIFFMLLGHEESYNASLEYIPTQEEIDSHSLMYDEDRPDFIP